MQNLEGRRDGGEVAGVSRHSVRFYTMGDANYFLGAVALVNSLRLVGHNDPITFLDLGLLPEQRAILETECDVVDIERDPRDHPYTFQPYPAMLDPSGICVIGDSDVIVTRHLGLLIDAAIEGKIAGFADRIERHVPEWENIFGLQAPLQAGIPYINSGLIALDARVHRESSADGGSSVERSGSSKQTRWRARPDSPIKTRSTRC